MFFITLPIFFYCCSPRNIYFINGRVFGTRQTQILIAASLISTPPQRGLRQFK